MKIVTLNLWGGMVGKAKIASFMKKYEDADIFCFQEVFNLKEGEQDTTGVLEKMKQGELRLFELLGEMLPDHQGFFRPHLGSFYGLAMFVRKGIMVVREGDFFVHKNHDFIPEDRSGNSARNIQHVDLVCKGKPFSVFNFHGLWNGQGKSDTVARIQQSKKILAFLKLFPHDVVLAGDFNLLPDTESIKMLEYAGLQNLIKRYKITSTRTSLYKKELRLADYVFLSKGLSPKEFMVLPEEISDHSALLVEV